MIKNSNKSSNLVLKFGFQILSNLNFIKLLPLLLFNQSVNDQNLLEINIKVLKIFDENLWESENDKVISKLVEILKIAIQYKYTSLITPEDILNFCQDKNKIDDSQRIELFSLLPFYDIQNGNQKHCRKAVKSVGSVIEMLAGSKNENKCEKLDRLYYIDKHQQTYWIDYPDIEWSNRTPEILINFIFKKFHWDSDQKHLFRHIFEKFEIEHGISGFCLTKNCILDTILTIKSIDNSISFDQIWNMTQLCTDRDFDVRIIVSSIYIKTDTEFKYIMSEAMNCRIGRTLKKQNFDRSKINEISNLFINTNWSPAMITKLLEFTTYYETSLGLEEFLPFIIENEIFE